MINHLDLVQKKKNFLKYKKFNFPKNSFLILITGSGFYKNHETSIKILKKLIKSNKNIYIVKLGYMTKNFDDLIKKYSIKRNVIQLNILMRDDIFDLYKAIDCLLFPSLYEGFGWPPLEAMASGVPVVTSNVASIPEVVGNAGLKYNPYDVNGMHDAIKTIIDNKNFRMNLVKKGIKQSSLFSWKKYIEKYF